ncbi:MFS transporter [Cupriavidus agavae]|uniref:CP family cyanate transporter-like MFS transporter n=1 Tax=Cupriavidus agavae TaxID=1001822 RepID=A0A4Q7S2Q3_9BURK|nr:MFS transporter [Cupriavidus agavae]RZT39192.1 CP family cyanate transporter-like MFS transporter [Cupriavidus agavae]
MLAEIGQERQKSKSLRVFAGLGLFIMALSLRPGIVSIGPLVHAIQAEFGMKHAEAALLTAIPDICMAVFAILVPTLARRIGSDRVVLISLALLGVALVLRAFAGSPSSLLLATLLVGIGVAMSGPLIGGWIKTHFAGEAALFMGIYAAGLGVGATLAAMGSEAIAVASGGWRLGVGIWAVVCVLAIVSWKRLTSAYPSTPNVTHVRAAPAHSPLRSGRAWLIAAYFGINQFICYACFAWVGESSRELHINALSSGVNLGLFAAMIALSSFLGGMVTNRSLDRRAWLAWSAVLSVGGAALLWLSPGTSGALPVLAIAAGQGVCFALAMTLPLDNTGSHHEASQWTAFMLLIGYLVAAAGPFAFGFLRDVTGTFRASYGLLVAAALVLLILTPLLKPRLRDAQGTA